MVNHINKYASAQAIQDALDNGTLANPYVAMTSAGTIDYNSLEPTPEPSCYIGEWSEDGQGTYIFHVTDIDHSLWETQVKIGVLLGVYSDGNLDNLDVMLTHDNVADIWHMTLFSELASTTPEHDFGDGLPDFWDSGVMTDPDDSDAAISVSFDGADTFMFLTGDLHPLSMTTINPECE